MTHEDTVPAEGRPLPLLSARHLTKVHRGGGRTTTALDDVDLTVTRGDRLGIVGESGSGKSTLIRLLTALDRPTSGEVAFDGVDLAHAGRQVMARLRSSVQIVFQDPRSSLDPRMRVGSIIAEPLRSPLIRGARPADCTREAVTARVAELLVQVGLEPDAVRRYPHEFSGGQRQRIAIARALAPRPSVLVADEPVSALDVSVRAQVLNLLTDLVRDEGLTLVFVSHDLSVVRHLCEDLVVLRQGRIVGRGRLAEVWARPEEEYTAELIEARPRLELPD